MIQPLPRSRRKPAVRSAAAAAFAGATGWLRSLVPACHEGPVSDHFDGTRFHDPHGAPPKGALAMLRWMASGRGEKWPEWAPSPFADNPPARVDGTTIRIGFVGHATLLVQTAGLNLLFDPVWSQRASPVGFAGPKRVNDPGIAFDALPPIDAVLVSHGHYDHLDVATLSRLAAAHRPRVITPLGNDVVMRAYDPAIAAEAFDWHQRVALARDVAVTLVPLRHWSARGLFDRNKTLWAGFVVETPGGRIYHVTDSGYGEGLRFREARERYGPFRLAILPIGAYEPRWFMRDQHMNPEEAVRAFVDCGADLALAHHHGTFKLTDEAIDAPAIALSRALEVAGIEARRSRVLRPGQAWEIANPGDRRLGDRGQEDHLSGT
jgi:L-ascorbate metabolism protein UlaG (beta-lactamase superfamily)